MWLLDKVRYKLGRWRALGGAYRTEIPAEVSRALQQTPGSMTSGPVPGARYDSDKPQHDEHGAEH